MHGKDSHPRDGAVAQIGGSRLMHAVTPGNRADGFQAVADGLIR